MACACGHLIEEHGQNPKNHNSMACTEEDCDCIAFEEDPWPFEETDDDS